MGGDGIGPGSTKENFCFIFSNFTPALMSEAQQKNIALDLAGALPTSCIIL